MIDSRTGLTDVGGICTIQLPDIVVAMFTANHQSLYGVRDVMRLAQHARQSLAYDRMPLTIFPLPSRFGTRVEFKESKKWLELFTDALGEFYDDWLPKWVDPRLVLERVKIPQIDYFGFGEKLAVIDQGINNPESMGYAFDKLSTFLASDFADIKALVGPEIEEIREKAESSKKEKISPKISKKSMGMNMTFMLATQAFFHPRVGKAMLFSS